MSNVDVLAAMQGVPPTPKPETAPSPEPGDPAAANVEKPTERVVSETDLKAMSFADAPKQLPLQTICLMIIAIVGVLTVITQLGPVLIPLLSAIFLFFIIRPFTVRMSKLGVPHWVTYVLIVVGIVGTIAALAMFISQDAQQFTAKLPQMQERAETLLKKVPTFGSQPLSADNLSETLQLQPSDIFHNVFGTAWHFSEAVLMVLFYLVFVLLDAEHLPNRVRLAFPQQGAKLVRSFEKISDGISRYIRVKTFISLGMAVSVGLILAAFGVSNWVFWALLTFLLNYITYIGSLMALVPPIVISLLEFSRLDVWILLTVILLVNRFVWIDFLEIRYTGQQLRINNALLLFAIIFWGWFWGIPGMVLAVPMLSALRIILAQFDITRPWALMISED